MKKILLFSFALLAAQALSAQCECYLIDHITIPADTTGVMRVRIKNSCSGQAYWHLWVVQNETDTIGRFDQCFCGFIQPDDQWVDFDVSTTLTTMPPFGTYKVIVGYHPVNTNFCESVPFTSSTTYNPSDIIALKLYPNPGADLLTVELEKRNDYTVEVFNPTGQKVYSNLFINTSFLPVEIAGLAKGNYVLRVRCLQDDSFQTERKFVKM
jgi:hypothetical protein